MQTLALRAWNRQDFQLTLDFSNWIAAGFDLSPSSTIVLRAGTTETSPPVLLFTNQPADASRGRIALATKAGGGLKLLRFTAPASLIADRVIDATQLVYDVRLTTSSNAVRALFGGTLEFLQGVADGSE